MIQCEIEVSALVQYEAKNSKHTLLKLQIFGFNVHGFLILQISRLGQPQVVQRNFQLCSVKSETLLFVLQKGHLHPKIINSVVFSVKYHYLESSI